jgi:hypothetical protein
MEETKLEKREKELESIVKIDFMEALEWLQLRRNAEVAKIKVRMYFAEVEEISKAVKSYDGIPNFSIPNNEIVAYTDRCKHRLVRKDGQVLMNQSCLSFSSTGVEIPQFPVSIRVKEKSEYSDGYSNFGLMKFRPKILNRIQFSGKTNWRVAYIGEAEKILAILQEEGLVDIVAKDYKYGYATNSIHYHDDQYGQNREWISEIHFGGIINGVHNTYPYLARNMLYVSKEN